MAEVGLFHHVQGLTPGVLAFADRLREAGHTVTAPDLFDGRSDAHLFSDSSLPSYDPAATELMTGRILAFLSALG
jgi:dienelactone hydrolase